MRAWQTTVVLALLSTLLLLAPGCASRHRPSESSSIESIERPARALGEEESLADKIGEVGVVLLVVGGAIAGIVVPLLFFL